MSRSRWHRSIGAYLALFFLAVDAAPHHHLNGLEDLLLDQRSDSGIIVQAFGRVTDWSSIRLRPVRVLRDEACPACFTADFVCAPAASSLFVFTLTPLLPPPKSVETATPELLPNEASSRAPPRVS